MKSFAAAVEAQARFALHLHALMSILGFRTPNDVRKLLTADFQDGVRRLWEWVSSLHWRAPEGYAAYLREPAAMQILRHSELMRVKPLQKEQLRKGGYPVDRINDIYKAQAIARGISLQQLTLAKPRSQFKPFMPDFYGDDR